MMRSRCFRHAAALFLQSRPQQHGARVRTCQADTVTTIDKCRFSDKSKTSETLELSKKRLIMRVNNTGMKELDIVLTGFLSTRMELWNMQKIEEFHALLDIDTPVLYRTFILMQQLPDELRLNSVAADLRQYTLAKMLKTAT